MCWCAGSARSSTQSVGSPTKYAKTGKILGTVYGETEKEALANAQKEFAKTDAEKKRIYLRSL
jgi:hypothetical protein